MRDKRFSIVVSHLVAIFTLTLLVTSTNAQTFTVLHSFDGWKLSLTPDFRMSRGSSSFDGCSPTGHGAPSRASGPCRRSSTDGLSTACSKSACAPW